MGSSQSTQHLNFRNFLILGKQNAGHFSLAPNFGNERLNIVLFRGNKHVDEKLTCLRGLKGQRQNFHQEFKDFQDLKRNSSPLPEFFF